MLHTNKSIATVTDEEYSCYFEVFYNSFFHKVKGVDLLVSAINIKDKQFFSNKYNKAKIFYTDIELTEDFESACAGRGVSKKIAYCNNARFLILEDFLELNYNVIYIDVDTIFIKDICYIFNHFANNDLILVPHLEKINAWRGGLIGLKNNKICREIISSVRQKLLEGDRLYKWGNQGLLCDSINSFITYIKIKELSPLVHCDYINHADESYTWSGKGARKGYNQYRINKNESELKNIIGYTKSDKYINKMIEYGFNPKLAEL